MFFSRVTIDKNIVTLVALRMVEMVIWLFLSTVVPALLAWFSRFEGRYQERVFGTACFGRWIRRSSMERKGPSGSLWETIGVFGVAIRY